MNSFYYKAVKGLYFVIAVFIAFLLFYIWTIMPKTTTSKEVLSSFKPSGYQSVTKAAAPVKLEATNSTYIIVKEITKDKEVVLHSATKADNLYKIYLTAKIGSKYFINKEAKKTKVLFSSKENFTLLSDIPGIDTWFVKISSIAVIIILMIIFLVFDYTFIVFLNENLIKKYITALPTKS